MKIAAFSPSSSTPLYSGSVPLVRSIIVLIAFVALRALANPESDFDAANKLYEEGKFSQAAAAYQNLCRTNAGEAIFFNLGNAYLKAGQIGRAIAAYRQAQLLEPRDPDIRANLRFARNQVPGTTSQVKHVQQWLGQLTLNEWTLCTAAALWAWLLLQALVRWRPALRPTLRLFGLMTALATVACGVCVALAWHDRQSVRMAIVIVPETAARQGPFDESPVAFTVPDGAELRVLDQKDRWLQVSNGQRRIGWLLQEQALIAPGESRS